jgi:hypothetical protein
MADNKTKPEPTFETTSKIPVEPLYTPADLVGFRRPLFQSVSLPIHYIGQRAIASQVPEQTLRMTPQAVRAAYPARWSELIGLVASNQP